MITAESNTSIARPPADVFEFVSDLRNDPRWHTDILEARLAREGPIGQGTTFAIRFKPFMGQSEGSVTVSGYEPPRRLVLRGQMGKASASRTNLGFAWVSQGRVSHDETAGHSVVIRRSRADGPREEPHTEVDRP